MAKPIRKAIFPVAGLGTRFLPATKATPKEMITVVDKPLIQFAVEEAIAAGITQLIFITNASKRAIEDHFDTNHELEKHLELMQKDELLDSVRSILPSGVHCVYIRQPAPKGLGDAVLCAADVIGDEPFAVLLADDFIVGNKNYALQQMVDIYSASNGEQVVAVEEVPMANIHQYGVIKWQLEQGRNDLGVVQAMVEKPSRELAPSNKAIVGRYILNSSIFSYLKSQKPGAGGEIQLTDAIASSLSAFQTHALAFDGIRYDCGNKLGYLKATVELALRHESLKADFKDYLTKILNKD